MTKALELRELDDTELGDRLSEARKELFNLRFQLATGRLDNISRIGAVRKEIARIMTVEAERTTPGSTTGRTGAGAATKRTEEE